MKLSRQFLTLFFALFFLLLAVSCTQPDSGTPGGGETPAPCAAGHTWAEAPGEACLAVAANCRSTALYYKTCSVCGQNGSDTFPAGDIGTHSYTKRSPSSAYRVSAATCTEPAVYRYLCAGCGEVGSETYSYGLPTPHKITESVPGYAHLLSKNEESATFYKSCSVCGQNGKESECFTLPLGDAAECTFTSPTLTIYTTSPLAYGVTWNTDVTPVASVLQIKRAGDTAFTDILPSMAEMRTLGRDEKWTDIRVAKAVVSCEPGTTYIYRFYDYLYGITSPEYSFTAVDPEAESFTFVSFGDSQAAELGEKKEGYWFEKALASAGPADFYLHTGDIVQQPKYNENATDVLDYNRSWLTKAPLMATSGNHDAYDEDGVHKYFHYNMTEEPADKRRLYYSFVYGDVKFIVIDTNERSDRALGEEQYNWLVAELANNDKKWTVISMHYPMYVDASYGHERKATLFREQLASLFATYGVDLVIQGHDHVVSKTHAIADYDAESGATTLVEETKMMRDGTEYTVDPHGVIYIMNGPTGNQERWALQAESELYDYAVYTEKSKASSFAEYTVEGDSLTVTVKYYDHATDTVKVYHSFGIIKNE